MNNDKIAELVAEWVYEAADHIRSQLHQPLTVEIKESRTDLVTNLDKETEAYFRGKIKSHFPDEKVMGEEGISDEVTSLEGPVWIIDPIDGTINFVLQRNHFAIMLARYVDGIGQFGMIYNVMTDEYMSAIRDQGIRLNGQTFTPPFQDADLADGLVAVNTVIALKNKFNSQALIEQSMGLRMYGSAALETLAVVKGELIAYISPRLAPWDIAAGAVIAKEAGLKYTCLDGSGFDYFNTNAIILAYPAAHKTIRAHYDAYLEGPAN